MPACPVPIPEPTLIDYWTGDLDGSQAESLEEHLFACGACSDRLGRLADLGVAVSALARAGRIHGIVSRALLNRLQRDGVRIRMYSLAPGEIVPCAVFPGDDVIVTDLRGDFADVSAVTLAVTGADETPVNRYEDVPVASASGELLLVTPAALLRQLPSMRLDITLTSADDSSTVIGRYALEHTAQPSS